MQNPVIDVVYVLGTGSKWNNTEIRFSLRSLEKNLKDFGNVYVVGECPPFLQNVIHIPAADIFDPAVNADGNIITKVLAACKDKNLSEDFLFINDDHLLLKPAQAMHIPPFHKGDMTTFPDDYFKLNSWRERLLKTRKILLKNGYSANHFDCHTPIVFNKKRFIEIVSLFDYKNGIGFTMKSLYGNVAFSNAPLLKSQKKTVFRRYRLAELKERFENVQFLSFNDNGINDSLKWFLFDHFPERSHFERNDPSERVFDLYRWASLGKPYEMGAEIFKNHYRGKNLAELFSQAKTPTLQSKLNFKLNLLISQL